MLPDKNSPTVLRCHDYQGRTPNTPGACDIPPPPQRCLHLLGERGWTGVARKHKAVCILLPTTCAVWSSITRRLYKQLTSLTNDYSHIKPSGAESSPLRSLGHVEAVSGPAECKGPRKKWGLGDDITAGPHVLALSPNYLPGVATA
ncbi:hypothetical protein DPEC_G00313600 [Dallia pectoralis]|uniref:Uncharacterized protein n=1 Tax=Dallia pectoralis TaxID=75939 RepID=A0ACC2FC53_DALPE|nr:hypothetical protein DPEC_G00313600 [Dallia pectoralis]